MLCPQGLLPKPGDLLERRTHPESLRSEWKQPNPLSVSLVLSMEQPLGAGTCISQRSDGSVGLYVQLHPAGRSPHSGHRPHFSTGRRQAGGPLALGRAPLVFVDRVGFSFSRVAALCFLLSLLPFHLLKRKKFSLPFKVLVAGRRIKRT